MFLPQRAVIEGCIDDGPVIDGVEAADPGEAGGMVAFEELAEGDGAHLFECFRKVAFKVLGKVFPFSGLDGVAAKLDRLEVFQVFDVAWRLNDGLGAGLRWGGEDEQGKRSREEGVCVFSHTHGGASGRRCASWSKHSSSMAQGAGGWNDHFACGGRHHFLMFKGLARVPARFDRLLQDNRAFSFSRHRSQSDSDQERALWNFTLVSWCHLFTVYAAVIQRLHDRLFCINTSFP
jgi:hypothetical protein